MPLWEEMSRRFAKTVFIGEIHCFQRWEGGVFKGVEKPTLEEQAKDTSTEKDLKFKYHAIVAEGKVKNDEDNIKMGKDKVKLEDLKDLGTFDSQSAWKAAIDSP